MRTLLVLFIVGAAIASIGMIFGGHHESAPLPDPMAAEGEVVSLSAGCAGCQSGTCRYAEFRRTRPPEGR